MSVARCPRRNCGAELVERHDRMLGRITLVCLGCERNAARLCRECGAPHGRHRKDSMRCLPCMQARRLERHRLSTARERADPERRERVNARQRAYNALPAVRAKRLDYLRRYRAAHQEKAPRTALDRLYINEWQKRKYRTNSAHRQKMKREASERRRHRRARELAAKLASGLYRAVPIHKKKRKSVGERFVRLLPIAAIEAQRASA